MSAPGFHAMRADLVARGLIEPNSNRDRLTVAGNAYVDALLADLRAADAPAPPSKPPVRWKFKWREDARMMGGACG